MNLAQQAGMQDYGACPKPEKGDRAKRIKPKHVKRRKPGGRFSKEENNFFQWVDAEIAVGYIFCFLTKRLDVEKSHEGRHAGTGMKSPMNTIIPLCGPLHRAREQSVETFWGKVGIDPIPFAARFHDAYERRNEAGFDVFVEIQMISDDMRDLANMEFIEECLRRFT